MANNNLSPEDQAALDESLDLLSRYEEIPAYVMADKLGLIEGAKMHKDMAKEDMSTLNQALFDIGANTYNAAAVPINLVGQFFGYNPGLSGERFMENLPWEKGISSYGDRPQPRGDVDRPWGMEAPLVPFKEQPLGHEIARAIDRNIPAPVTAAPDTSVAAISYAVDDIDPKVKDVFDRILKSDKKTQLDYHSNMPENLQDALSEYKQSIISFVEKEKEVKTIESPYKTESEQREAMLEFDITEYTQDILNQYYGGANIINRD